MNSPNKISTGTHFMMGNLACAEGAIAAGCGFVAGYPITPASEVFNTLAVKMPMVGGTLLQMEDEISAVCAAIGASWSGLKAMTVTSGPGISLMQENIGFAVSTETPLVIIDVQRLGPSTGVPSVGLTADIVQVARGSHGDYQIIALCPESPQEMFDMTVRAFNLAEEFRVPVFVMADGFIGHMRERVVVPDEDDIDLCHRNITCDGAPLTRQDFLDPNVAPMPVFGRGLQTHVTSSCHDERGMRNLTDTQGMHSYIWAPIQKILSRRDRIIETVADYDDAKLILVSYGSVSRAARTAARLAQADGLSVGTLRLKSIWPFPDNEIRNAAEVADYILVLENNTGQLYPYIKAESAHACRVDFLGPRILGQIHDPQQILAKIKEMMK